MARLLTAADYEAEARATLSASAWDYFRGGADAERTLARNVGAFEAWEIWPRILVDVAERSLRTTVLGTPAETPILVAPMAYQRLAHPEGESAAARGASQAGAIFVLSTLASQTIEQVAAAAPGPKWFQLYVHKDRELTRSLVQRAERAGYGAIVLTADAPLLGRRLADERNGFSLPEGIRAENVVAGLPATEGSALASYFGARHDPSLTWRDLEWLRSLTRLPVAIKGLLRADDARRAAGSGVSAVIVSNHGGRQLDAVPATIDALPEIVAATEGRCEVLVDGGVRWGTDILIALALGAKAVLVGRPVLWGLAVSGAEGVAQVLRNLADELSRAMALAGCPDLASISRDLVRRRSAPRALNPSP